MNATPRLLALFASFGTFAFAAAPEVRVAASRELRVAIIDASKATPARDAMHQAFATSLSAGLTRQCGGPVGVRVKCVSADNAAFNLRAGTYDAVLAVGRAVPDALRRSEAMVLSAVPENGKRERTLYLLIPAGDDSLQSLLAAAFTGTMRDTQFLESYAAGDGRAPVAAGQRVAAQD